MGKPRLSDLSDEEQLKLKRLVTRELNEAAQNARDAGRQLAAARDGLEAVVARTVQAVTDAHMTRVNEHVATASAELRKLIQAEEQKTRDHYARLLGATSYQHLISFMIGQVYELVLPELNRVLRTLPGAPAVQVGTRAAGEPSVIVMDQATWRARKAAGTLPGTGITLGP